MEAKKNSLGQKIKRFRLINDIRQEDMADKLGISRATLINYEKGHTTINFEVLSNLKTSYPNFNEVDAPDQKPKIIENNIIDFKLLFKVLNGSRKNYFVYFSMFSIGTISFVCLHKVLYSSNFPISCKK